MSKCKWVTDKAGLWQKVGDSYAIKYCPLCTNQQSENYTKECVENLCKTCKDKEVKSNAKS